MVLSLAYTRPLLVSLNQASVDGKEKQASLTGSTGSRTSISGVPDALSFDKIINGGTCPPCTVRDFLNYTKYISHDAENLQFYLWYRDYANRFSKLPASEQALSPEWSAAQADADVHAVSFTKPVDLKIAAVFVGTDFEKKPEVSSKECDPFDNDWSSQPSPDERRDTASSTTTSGITTSAAAKAHEPFSSAGMQWTPFTPQPFRQEITRIISVYIAEAGPRQLNLSSRECTAVLHALQNTTHPSALRVALASAEYALRFQVHPNFIRWAVCNGNRPRVVFARGLGVVTVLLALVADVLLTLSSVGRGWRLVPLAGYVLGVATLFAAYKGMCVVLHGLHHRHVRPWELFADEQEEEEGEKGDGASLGSNSYEDEPWVGKYRRRNLLRKVFDREVWVQEPALRQIQDTVFVQSILCSVVVGAVLAGVFCAVPGGGFF